MRGDFSRRSRQGSPLPSPLSLLPVPAWYTPSPSPAHHLVLITALLTIAGAECVPSTALTATATAALLLHYPSLPQRLLSSSSAAMGNQAPSGIGGPPGGLPGQGKKPGDKDVSHSSTPSLPFLALPSSSLSLSVAINRRAALLLLGSALLTCAFPACPLCLRDQKKEEKKKWCVAHNRTWNTRRGRGSAAHEPSLAAGYPRPLHPHSSHAPQRWLSRSSSSSLPVCSAVWVRRQPPKPSRIGKKRKKGKGPQAAYKLPNGTPAHSTHPTPLSHGHTYRPSPPPPSHCPSRCAFPSSFPIVQWCRCPSASCVCCVWSV